MCELRQVWRVAAFNFRQWHKSPRIIMTFVLAFVMCLLLTDRATSFALRYGATMQLMEAFVWTFGDAGSILLSSLLLILLFADMPFISPMTPFYLVRTRRSVWVWGQVVYVLLASLAYMTFILVVTVAISAPMSFAGNMWSETGALLGYSGTGTLPASIKAMQMSYPYECAAHVFLLMTMYTLFTAMVMLAVNLRHGQFWSVMSVFILSVYGLALNPETIASVAGIGEAAMYRANVAAGWLSPLNQATYHMHNFGYDYLPRLWMTYALFGVLIAGLIALSIRGIRKYNFIFSSEV